MVAIKSSKPHSSQQCFFFKDTDSSQQWTAEEEEWLIINYPRIGKLASAELLGRSICSVRAKCSRLGLKQDRGSSFFRDWQNRAAKSKLGKKRPGQSDVLKKMHAEGKLVITDKQRKKISNSTKLRLEKNGHPRGNLGRKHSQNAKDAISRKSKRTWRLRTAEQKQALILKQIITRHANGTLYGNRMKTTWKAGWCEVGGKRKYFRSRWEANYARYLEWLKGLGEIVDWQHEPETFWFKDVRRGCVSYLPDFKVTEKTGSVVFHEVKGWMDARSKTKIKRMAKYHPSVKLIVIDAKQYQKLHSQLKNVVPGWES